MSSNKGKQLNKGQGKKKINKEALSNKLRANLLRRKKQKSTNNTALHSELEKRNIPLDK